MWPDGPDDDTSAHYKVLLDDIFHRKKRMFLWSWNLIILLNIFWSVVSIPTFLDPILKNCLHRAI